MKQLSAIIFSLVFITTSNALAMDRKARERALDSACKHRGKFTPLFVATERGTVLKQPLSTITTDTQKDAKPKTRESITVEPAASEIASRFDRALHY